MSGGCISVSVHSGVNSMHGRNWCEHGELPTYMRGKTIDVVRDFFAHGN